MNNDATPTDNSDKNPASNERVPGQGNSSDGLTRRLGPDLESRGEKEVEKLDKKEGMGEDDRSREGSQGVTRGQS